MNLEQQQAYGWAKSHDYPSVAAQYARALASAVDDLQAQLADYHHMSELVDGKMGENQRLRRINENLQEQLAASQRRGRAAAEIRRLTAERDAKWISVKDRLPEKYGTYLVYLGMPDKLAYGSGVHTAWYYDGTKDFSFSLNTAVMLGENCSTKIKSASVTHWMPLPEPPKEDVCTKN